MSLKTLIAEDVKTAMKSGDRARLSTLRMLSAELKQREVVEAVELTDPVVIAVIEKMIKQRRDAQAQYLAAGRAELADKEAQEIAWLAAYLPQRLSPAELEDLIVQGIAATGAASLKDMGKLMAWLKPKVAGRADMGELSSLVKARFA
jgi:uncharacterized protein YqeY